MNNTRTTTDKSTGIRIGAEIILEADGTAATVEQILDPGCFYVERDGRMIVVTTDQIRGVVTEAGLVLADGTTEAPHDPMCGLEGESCPECNAQTDPWAGGELAARLRNAQDRLVEPTYAPMGDERQSE